MTNLKVITGLILLLLLISAWFYFSAEEPVAVGLVSVSKGPVDLTV